MKTRPTAKVKPDPGPQGWVLALPPLAVPGCLPYAILALLCLVTGCHPPSTDLAWTGTETDSSGIVIVANPETGLWPESKGWTLEEDLRIGTVGGDLPYQFGQVGTIAVNGAGEILVSDAQAQNVRVFSSDGAYLRSIGAPGSGPGELGLGASVILLAPGDTVLVPDSRNRRINRFGPEGAILGSVPLEPERGRPLRFNTAAAGKMAVQIRPVASPDRPGVESMDAILEVEPSGEFGDTLLRFPSGGLFQGPGIHYFTPEPIWNISDSLTVVYGVNNQYRLGFYGRDGSLQRVVTRPFALSPITDRDIRAFFSYLDRAWLDAGVPPARLPANHRNVHFADFLPAFASIHLGYEGSLWVQRVQAPGLLSDEEVELYNFVEDFGAADWDVFDDRGRYLGVVTMPPRFAPRLFRGGEVYGVWRDQLDVQYVMRLRLVER